ncbi:MAG: GNAT family N-acetyltransferase, partial [Actinomycetota bacterium]|nr:GNAT family N-acetyltransferase [Actinomycetota bacterium]
MDDGPACDAVIATLPYFFGQAAGIAECATAVRSEPGLVAVHGSGTVGGFMTYRFQRPGSAEITWMAVRQDLRRRGIGRRLVAALDDQLSRRGVRVMFVIT